MVKFVEFVTPGKEMPVYVNPEQVVEIYPLKQNCVLVLAVGLGNETKKRGVVGTLEDVVAKLEGRASAGGRVRSI